MIPIKTEYGYLNNELILREKLESFIIIYAVDLVLTKQHDSLIECRLIFQVSPKLYQRIETEALFNLKPEIRSPFSAGEFNLSFDIQIEASLDPDLLPQLAERATDANQAAAYLQTLSQEQLENALLSTYSWYALEVKQQQETGETGYRTLWCYLQPSAIAQNSISSEQISEAMVNFAKEWTNSNLSGISEDNITQTVEQMTQAFEELAGNISEMTQKAISEAVEEVTDVFEELTQDISEITEKSFSARPIFEAVINFFETDDWPFSLIEGEPVLETVFQGQNGKLSCYAKAREEQRQFVFYSICPINVPENKRLAVAEFITRANYGMVIGNFELDFTDGEIRYKTSIDVEGDRLSFALIKTLVYANVTMMDEYLPGIMAVIYGEMNVGEAIAQIES